MIRDLYTLRYHKKVLFIIICVELTYKAKSTDGFSHTYFQTCMREGNQLDESIKSSPTVSVFKRELMHLIKPLKRSLFGFHDIEGVRQ